MKKEKVNYRINPVLMDYVRAASEKSGKTHTQIFEEGLQLHRIVNEQEEMKKALETLKSVNILG